jgi:hypothetical protein
MSSSVLSSTATRWRQCYRKPGQRDVVKKTGRRDGLEKQIGRRDGGRGERKERERRNQ